MRRVLVTGATGFIGRQLCNDLVRAGHQVRGTTRHSNESRDRIEWAEVSDFSDRNAVSKALHDVTDVYHLAGRVHKMRGLDSASNATFFRDNVEGTRVWLEEAVRARIERFLFVSTVKVMGESCDEPFVEEMDPHPYDAYARSKLEAEGVVRALAGGNKLHAPIMRLPLVYGPGMGANMLTLFRGVDKGIPLPFANVNNRRSLAFSGNVTAALIAAMESPAAGSDVFFVSDGRDVSTQTLVRQIAQSLNKNPRLFPFPPSLLRATARILNPVSSLGILSSSSAAVDRLLGSLTVDATKLASVTGFRPPFSFEEGIQITADWFRALRGSR